MLGFSLLAGTVADALNRRKLMLITQTAMAALAALLGLLTARGLDSIWAIYAVTAASAGVGAFDLPARQSLVPNLVPRRDLANAFSLGSIAMQTGAILGPAIGGLVLARLGVASVYWINACSFLAVIGALLLMGPVHQEIRSRADGAVSLAAVTEGVRFIRGQPIVLSSMLLDFFASFFSSATALLPIFATQILRVGPVGYGWLVSAQSVGALAAASALTLAGGLRRQGPALLAAVTAFGLATIVFGLSRTYDYAPGEAFARVLEASDVIVLPFRASTTSGSLVQALSWPRPAIVPAMGCLPSQMDVAAGVLYPPDDPDALARAMRRVREIDLGAARAAARVSAVSVGWDEIARRTLQAYRA